MAEPKRPRPRILVLAGVNGAGKSSVAGAFLRHVGARHYDPDLAARALLAAKPRLGQARANALAWEQGRRFLERAISKKESFAFETTLGGGTIVSLLERAARLGIPVTVWFCGLSTPELHIERVRRRVARGGHDIPEADIRRRFDASRSNLIRLLPLLAELVVYDNSEEADPQVAPPSPRLLLRWRQGKVVGPRSRRATPAWARPIVAAAEALGR